jgi:hypothetical protein
MACGLPHGVLWLNAAGVLFSVRWISPTAKGTLSPMNPISANSYRDVSLISMEV